jgi:hypothetical protein
MYKRITVLAISALLVTGCSSQSNNANSAQEKRNKFDVCKITFLKQVPDKSYNDSPDFYDKQAEEGCSPLLTLDDSDSFINPTPSLIPKKESITLDQVCKIIRQAAFAHRDFGQSFFEGDGDIYETYYAKVRSYMKKAVPLLQAMGENNKKLVEYAQEAIFDSYGFNGTWKGAEGRLYSTCNITKDSVDNDFDVMMGYN